MGYIKEYKGVDLTVLDKEMTEDEKKKLSAYIVKRKNEISEIQKIKPSVLKNKKIAESDSPK